MVSNLGGGCTNTDFLFIEYNIEIVKMLKLQPKNAIALKTL